MLHRQSQSEESIDINDLQDQKMKLAFQEKYKKRASGLNSESGRDGILNNQSPI